MTHSSLRLLSRVFFGVCLGGLATLLLAGVCVDRAFATYAEPPTAICLPERCETCLEASGPEGRCVKCGPIEGCEINKGGGPRSESPIARDAEAKDDVDIYDSPVKPRKVIGMMREKQDAPVFELHPDGWAKLKLPASPDFGGGFGWVALDHLQLLIVK
jgi:hypothetical protein